MEAAPDDERNSSQPRQGSSRLPSRITLGWPFFTYQLSLRGLLFVAAAAAVVIIAAIAMAISTLGSSPATVADISPFRLEVAMVEQQPKGEFHTSITQEWQDERHFRYSFTREPNAAEPGYASTFLADGDYIRTWGSSEPVVRRTELRVQAPAAAASVVFYMQYGQVAGVRTMPELIAKLTTENANFDPKNPRYARIVGQDTWLGIPVQVVEYGPVWSNGSTELRASGQDIQSGASGRVWVDPTTAFILRNESTIDEGWTVVVEVTSIEYGAEFAPGTFEFVPPPGSTEIIE